MPGHRIDDKVGVGIAGTQPQGGRPQAAVHVHDAGPLAGARYEDDAPAVAAVVYGCAAQIVVRLGKWPGGGDPGGYVGVHDREARGGIGDTVAGAYKMAGNWPEPFPETMAHRRYTGGDRLFQA